MSFLRFWGDYRVRRVEHKHEHSTLEEPLLCFTADSAGVDRVREGQEHEQSHH